MVVVNITARDSNGNNITDLKVSDIQVLEDGTPQKVASFEYQKDSNPPYYAVGYYTGGQARDSKFRRVEVKIVGRTDVRAMDYRQGYFSDDDFTPPIATYSPQAEYSDQARRAKWSGTVRLRITVTETGEVRNIVVTRPLGMGLDEKAIEAVNKWKFNPAQRQGRPVTAETEVDVQFHLL